jgi:hypothetical protein
LWRDRYSAEINSRRYFKDGLSLKYLLERLRVAPRRRLGRPLKAPPLPLYHCILLPRHRKPAWLTTRVAAGLPPLPQGESRRAQPPPLPVSARWRGLSLTATEPEGHGSSMATAGTSGCTRGVGVFGQWRNVAAAKDGRQVSATQRGRCSGGFSRKSGGRQRLGGWWMWRAGRARRRGDDYKAWSSAGRGERIDGWFWVRRLCGVTEETVQATVKETGRAISLHRAAAGDDDNGRQQPCARRRNG